jgi:hypothetical protein
MGVDIVTKDDLQSFRVQLLSDIRVLLETQANERSKLVTEGYKTKDVRRILGCSVNKLVSLRIARKIRWKKVGGTIYYNKEDVRRLVEEGF